jgi:hypothetical protein
MTNGAPGGAIMPPDQMDEAPASFSPPTPTTSGGVPAWLSGFRSNERRWWTAALAAVVVISATAIGLLYVDDTNNQGTVRSLQTQNESLTGRNLILNDQLKSTQTNLTATLGELATTKAQLEHPHLVIWNTPLTIKDYTYYLAGGIPDTFTYHLKATSSGAMNVSILTLQQWVAASKCVDPGGGTTNYCMHHSGAVWSSLGQSSVNYDFHLAEGCADYISVFTAPSSVTVTPDISVTYNPASSATGACS